LQALIKSNRDGVILVGMNSRILVMNVPALQMLNLPGLPEDWLGQPLRDARRVLHIYAPHAARTTRREILRIRKGNEPPSEGEYEVQSHTIHWLSLPVLAGTTPLGRLLVLRDVTDERAVERLREDMTRTMVHDLRNPLASIASAIEYLQGNTTLVLADDEREVLDIAYDSTYKMLGLVNSILDVSRLESGRMLLKYTQFGVGDLIVGVLRSQEPLAVDKGLRLASDVPAALPPAWADVDLIERVLQNLVGNAIKFTPSGGKVDVTAKVEQSESQPVLWVSVSDNGSGIPTDIRGRLFQKFVTGRQRGRGSGLGLAFCKLAIEAHRQHISVESEPEHGATFTFSLATSPSSPPPAAALQG
jgi:signal transduction histidine kinase